MPSKEKLAKKNAYFAKLVDLCVNTPNALLVSVDNISSKQMQDIRMELRGKAVVLMGHLTAQGAGWRDVVGADGAEGSKNTMIRKALANGHTEHPEAGLDKLRAIIQGNLGFIFATRGALGGQNCTTDDIREVLGKLLGRAVKRSVKQAAENSIVDWFIPSGPTGMDPSQTSFFQALNIGTKIVKGQIELVSDFKILAEPRLKYRRHVGCVLPNRVGERVTASGAVLLNKLGIRPFEYKMEVKYVFQDAAVFSAAVLDMSEEMLIQKFLAGIANMAAFSREVGIPTEAGLPHAFGNAFRNVAALVADIDFTFKEVEDVKKFLEDPDAYAAANPVAAAAPAAGGGEAKKEEKKAMRAELVGREGEKLMELVKYRERAVLELLQHKGRYVEEEIFSNATNLPGLRHSLLNVLVERATPEALEWLFSYWPMLLAFGLPVAVTGRGLIQVLCFGTFWLLLRPMATALQVSWHYLDPQVATGALPRLGCSPEAMVLAAHFYWSWGLFELVIRQRPLAERLAASMALAALCWPVPMAQVHLGNLSGLHAGSCALLGDLLGVLFFRFLRRAPCWDLIQALHAQKGSWCYDNLTTFWDGCTWPTGTVSGFSCQAEKPPAVDDEDFVFCVMKKADPAA
ncbi:unnamed protein product [Durusdinium trenchii]|uniref:Large ribosomal subunit protein uL10-like insertion domain-containing protein n=1 Tax=Durusdinium trenchii TaxID=1381693 RepID=A0ABP0QVY0_9DINO